ncbi:MAG: ATPase [Rhodobacteraceae bacterium]|nr:ATPase [Paracoccaceae bacterium]
MTIPAVTFSDDQAEAFDSLSAMLRQSGIDLDDSLLMPPRDSTSSVMAVMGKAGSGKTLLLAHLYNALAEAGVEVISGDYESRRRRDKRTLAILAPTNKAASVLRMRGVPATTIHRILYTPVYDPEYERIAEWLAGMLDDRQFDDLKEIFPTLVVFGDPAQLAPVNQSGNMVFDTLADPRKLTLERVHRQTQDNPILDLAHALADPQLEFHDFEQMIQDVAQRDDRVQWGQRVEVDLMARSPVLVWRNATRVRLIQAFRTVYDAPDDSLLPGEPLICDGIELPMKHRKKRIDLEARGLIKGAQVIYLGPGRKPGFSRLHVVGAEDPQLSAASIVKIEKPDEDEPFIPFAARMGATFLHGAAVTIHKAQGSQWDTVQVFGPDIYTAARMGRTEAGTPLWKRLAYVAITRAQERLIWVVRNRLSKPTYPLTIDDLRKVQASELSLAMQDAEND